MTVDSNIKMWCPRCQAPAKGDTCPWCIRGLTVCAECGYCFGCESTPEQRVSGEDW